MHTQLFIKTENVSFREGAKTAILMTFWPLVFFPTDRVHFAENQKTGKRYFIILNGPGQSFGSFSKDIDKLFKNLVIQP